MRKTLIIAALASLCLALPAANALPGDPAEPTEIEIDVAPKTVVLGSRTTWVTVHTNLPYYTVDSATLTLSGIPIRWSKSDSRGYFVGKFSSDDVKGIVEPGTVTLVLEGETYLSGPFIGSAEITVIAGKVR